MESAVVDSNCLCLCGLQQITSIPLVVRYGTMTTVASLKLGQNKSQEKERGFPGYGHSSLLLNLTPPIPNMFIKNFPNTLPHFTFSIQQEIHFIGERNWGDSLEPWSFKAMEQN